MGCLILGSTGCVLPEGITELQLKYPTAQILNKSRILMPLCLTNSEFIPGFRRIYVKVEIIMGIIYTYMTKHNKT